MTKSGDVQLYDKKRNSPDVKKRVPVKRGGARSGVRKAQAETFSQLVDLRLEK